MKIYYWFLFSACTWLVLPAGAATRADLHVAVYSAGFLIDTQREVTYGEGVRRVQVKTKAKGTAQGETADSSIEIDRLAQGVQWHLDPETKTYREARYESSFQDTPISSASSTEPPTLNILNIEHTVSGPLGSATINGYPCQSYTIRIVADFSNPQTKKIVATETLLEKLWVTDKAPGIEKFRKVEGQFQDAVYAAHGTEKANFRWLLREFNRTILESRGNPDDFKALQKTYQEARATIKGVTVRQLIGWNWRPKDASAPGSDSVDDINSFIGSIAAGLGAPPDQEGKTPLPASEKPRWVLDLEKDLGRNGPTAMMVDEVMRARPAQVTSDFFEIPQDYRKL